MLFFFQNLLKKYWEKRAFLSFLGTAFFELLLIVFAIYISVKVEACSGEKKDRVVEMKSLCSLYSELTHNHLELQKYIKLTSNNINEIEDILCYMSGELRLSDSYVALALYNLANDISFDPKNGVKYDIINSDKVNILEDSNIRTFLQSWESENTDISKLEHVLSSHINNKLYPNLSGILSFRNIYEASIGRTFQNYNIIDLKKTIDIENDLIRLWVLLDIVKRRYESLNSEILTIIFELKNNKNIWNSGYCGYSDYFVQ